MNKLCANAILSTVLLISACGGGSSDSISPQLADKVINGLRYHFSLNGEIEIINDNSWVFTSHTNANCLGKTNSECRKIDIGYTERNIQPTDAFEHKFTFQLVEINEDSPPESVIIFQDWVRIYPDDEDGNRPITTIKLIRENNRWYLAHFDNSWQWSAPPATGNPSSLPDNRKNGQYPIDVGVDYRVSMEIKAAGNVTFKVDDNLVSDVSYQTKSATQNHAIQWGMYWSKGYNSEHDPLKRMIISIEEFSLPNF